MAVTKGSVSVKGGTGNWTKKDVMDALETALQQSGACSGTPRYGVPNCVVSSGYSKSSSSDLGSDYMNAGGRLPGDNDWHVRNFDVTASGSAGWIVQEWWLPTGLDPATDTITVSSMSEYGFVTGKKVTWAPGESTNNNNIGGLTLNSDYYLIRVTDTTFKLASSYANAIAGTAVDILSAPTNSWAYDENNTMIFKDKVSVTESNPTDYNSLNRDITCQECDTLHFHFPNDEGSSFALTNQDLSSESYDTSKELIEANSANLDNSKPYSTTYYPDRSTDSGHISGGVKRLRWQTREWAQTEDEVAESWDKPTTKLTNLTPGTRSYASSSSSTSTDLSTIKWYPQNHYYYTHTSTSIMKGKIIVRGRFSYQNASSTRNPFWYVTVPASVGNDGAVRSAQDLKLRITRIRAAGSYYQRGEVHKIEIINVASTASVPYDANTQQGGGWIDRPTFTILGSKTGGVDGAVAGNDGTSGGHDITFGAATVAEGAGSGSWKPSDGTVALCVTDYKGVDGFHQLHPDGHFAIARVEHNSAKKYGVTYYSFSFDDGGSSGTWPYLISIQSGVCWENMNAAGATTAHSGDDTTPILIGGYSANYGYFNGNMKGEDYAQNQRHISMDMDNSYQAQRHMSYTSSSNYNTYPLKINWYRAPDEQGNDFVIYSFIRTENAIDTAYGTFCLHRGSLFGNPNPGCDLDNLFLGGVTDIETDNTTDIKFTTYAAHRHYQYNDVSYDAPMSEPYSVYGVTRNFLYGYLRNAGGYWNYSYSEDNYGPNIQMRRYARDGTDSMTKMYYRNHTYEGPNMTSATDWYKPISGIPISKHFAPCPYYFPDDFVLIQIAQSPGGTVYRPGDTITISGSEKYEVIKAGIQNNTLGLDESTTSYHKGMVFGARIPN